MQDVTAAYARGDLHGLLQLEVEWLVPASGDAARLSGDKLRAYTAILKEQATELEADMQLLRLQPRYAALIVEGRSVLRWSSTVRAKWNDSTA